MFHKILPFNHFVGQFGLAYICGTYTLFEYSCIQFYRALQNGVEFSLIFLFLNLINNVLSTA